MKLIGSETVSIKYLMPQPLGNYGRRVEFNLHVMAAKQWTSQISSQAHRKAGPDVAHQSSRLQLIELYRSEQASMERLYIFSACHWMKIDELIRLQTDLAPLRKPTSWKYALTVQGVGSHNELNSKKYEEGHYQISQLSALRLKGQEHRGCVENGQPFRI